MRPREPSDAEQSEGTERSASQPANGSTSTRPGAPRELDSAPALGGAPSQPEVPAPRPSGSGDGPPSLVGVASADPPSSRGSAAGRPPRETAPGDAPPRPPVIEPPPRPAPRPERARLVADGHGGYVAEGPPLRLLDKVLRWLKPPRKLKFTREGKYYLGITLGVGFAAINTGNNLLYLLLGMLLSLIVVSGVMSDLSLRQLTVTRRLPTRAQVGRAHLVEIEVYNHKKRVPSYAIEVEDLRAGQPADKRCFFLKISPASAQVAAYRRTPTRRGRDRHTGFRIATRFPFGLFEKSREVEAEGDLIIYPAVDPVRLPAEDRGRRTGGVGAAGRGGGDETYSLRLMREGDDPRDIYWRKSTINDQLVLRERSRETRPDVDLVIDPIRPKTADDGYAHGFERRIREVASRAVAHIKRGDGVIVTTTLGDRVRADRSLGSDPVLRFLALLDAVDESRVAEVWANRGGRRGLPMPRAVDRGVAADAQVPVERGSLAGSARDAKRPRPSEPVTPPVDRARAERPTAPRGREPG